MITLQHLLLQEQQISSSTTLVSTFKEPLSTGREFHSINSSYSFNSVDYDISYATAPMWNTSPVASVQFGTCANSQSSLATHIDPRILQNESSWDSLESMPPPQAPECTSDEVFGSSQEAIPEAHSPTNAEASPPTPAPAKRYGASEEDELSLKFDQLHAVHGLHHTETIRTLDNLASLLKAQGRYSAAEHLASQVEVAYEHAFGKYHRTTLLANMSRIDAIACQGRYNTAKTEINDLRRRAGRYLGFTDLATISITSLTSKILYALAEYVEAEKLAGEVYRVQSKKLGRFQRDTLAAKAFWAVVLVALNQRSAGETLLREVVDEQRPQDDIRALDRIGDLAYTLCMQGRFKESEELECYILQRQTPILGPEHPNTLRTIVRLGRTLSLQRKFKEARDMLMEVLERQGRVLGERHREVWITCEEIARCLRDMGNGGDAKQYFRRAWGE
jgi:hypothetical protein